MRGFLMTNYNKQITFLCTSLALLIPFPGRIAFGIFALVHFNVCVILLTLILHAIKKLGFEKIRLGICAMELVALTVLYTQILAIFCPIASLTLGFSLYLSAASSVCVVLLNFHNKNSIKADCLEKFKNAVYLSAFVLIIYILRDILGFGTVSLPAWKNLFIVKIPVLLNQTSFTDFFATIPGCMLLITLVFFAYTKLFGEKNA